MAIKKLPDLSLHFRIVADARADPPFKIGSAFSRLMTAATIFVVVVSSGPYKAMVPMGYFCGDAAGRTRLKAAAWSVSVSSPLSTFP